MGYCAVVRSWGLQQFDGNERSGPCSGPAQRVALPVGGAPPGKASDSSRCAWAKPGLLNSSHPNPLPLHSLKIFLLPTRSLRAVRDLLVIWVRCEQRKLHTVQCSGWWREFRSPGLNRSVLFLSHSSVVLILQVCLQSKLSLVFPFFSVFLVIEMSNPE